MRLDRKESLLLLIDFQSGLEEFVCGHFLAEIEQNTVSLCKAAISCGVPIHLTTLEFGSLPQHQCTFLDPVRKDITVTLRRRNVSALADEKVAAAIADAGRPQLILAGPMLETSLTATAVDALGHGFDVGVVLDACGSASPFAYHVSAERLRQASAVPLLWEHVALGWCDTSDPHTRDAVRRILVTHHSAFGRAISE